MKKALPIELCPSKIYVGKLLSLSNVCAAKYEAPGGVISMFAEANVLDKNRHISATTALR